MPAYLLTYHDGQVPRGDDDEAELALAWAEWLDSLGDALIDAGNPTGDAVRIGPDGTLTPLPSIRLTGYSMIEADDLEGATLLARSCPVLTFGGSIEVSELIELDFDDDLFDDEEEDDEDDEDAPR